MLPKTDFSHIFSDFITYIIHVKSLNNSENPPNTSTTGRGAGGSWAISGHSVSTAAFPFLVLFSIAETEGHLIRDGKTPYLRMGGCKTPYRRQGGGNPPYSKRGRGRKPYSRRGGGKRP